MVLLVRIRLIRSLQAPGEEERLEILKCLLADDKLAFDVSLEHIAMQTAALVPADLRDLICRAQAACIARVGLVTDDIFHLLSLNSR